ncbi:hypothetical protein CYMTET_9231 [Cymbomonas tetramitiformis]|uniref:Uncharacterized protein n=1 Tax=Cymbomonas tetramitiformis TaxID=36881 RepID=A0AAE0GRW7_9CHLO|nr:hypothetical protein CYMTET_9231 [Cymbomonas tetramitiformis]
METLATTHPHDGKRVLLEIACRLLGSGGPFEFRGPHASLASVHLLANIDPSSGVANFNAALTSARRKNTLDDDEVKSQLITALDSTYYPLVIVSRLLLHRVDQRAAGDLYTVQQ